MKITFSVIFFIVLNSPIYSITLKGIVVDADNGLPIEFANVFVSQTSIGTITNIEGNFTLDVKFQGFFKLAVTHISYQTYTCEINTNDKQQFLIIKLKIASQQIGEIKITPHVWNEEYYKLFCDRFIGQSYNSKECIIENPKSINFFGSKKGYLKAVSDSNIIIRNNGLGYRISYKLEKFELFYTIDSTFLGTDSIANETSGFRKTNQGNNKKRYYTEFKEDFLKYYGEPSFTDIINESKKPEEILLRRANTFYGSTLHFFRSLYADSLEENGFNVYKIKTTKNIKEILPAIPVHSRLIDSINGIKSLKVHFDSVVMVRYINRGEPRSYISNPENYKRLTLTKGQQTSLLKFDSLVFTEYGNAKGYIKYNGYLNWLRISELLPFDFDEQTIKAKKDR